MVDFPLPCFPWAIDFSDDSVAPQGLFAAPVLSKDPYGTGFFAESPKATFDKLPTFEVRLSPGDVFLGKKNSVWYDLV